MCLPLSPNSLEYLPLFCMQSGKQTVKMYFVNFEKVASEYPQYVFRN